MSSVLLESRPFKPFKSCEEYLEAMKEDLAEWLQTMYPHLNISAGNFMDKLESGVALCEHANAVKLQAIEYVEKKQAKKIMTKSVTGSVKQAQSLISIIDVKYTTKPGTFFARDNVSNFIKWCRISLEIIECLLFESDDLIMRKNEKHVILCLLEVARSGAKFGMLAPMLVQMERQIDREIAADQKKLNEGIPNQSEIELDDDDSDDDFEEPVLMYGPVPQIVTNDLKSLDEMVRDLVEKCTCPTQFPMIRVSEGKYRIGDTKVLIFVRILRNHVMVRVGGGWDTLSHFLDKHDPCRCRAQHRTTQGAKLVNKPGAPDLHGSHVYYDRSPSVTTIGGYSPNNSLTPNSLGPPMNSLNRSRSRSPSHLYDNRRSVSPNFPRKSLAPPPPRSRSPTPNFVSTHQTKLAAHRSCPKTTSPRHNKHVTSIQIPVEYQKMLKSEASLQVSETDASDTTSEVSDEGYRSLGLVQEKNKKRSSLHSQNSYEDAYSGEHPNDGLDDFNDIGLRKTQYSNIYDPDKASKNRLPISRASSLERPEEKSPKKTPPSLPKKSPSTSKTNTWNGRPKQTRPSLSPETFVRNTPSRRSVSSMDRRSSSTSTSPTKKRLQDEVMQAVTQNGDVNTMVEEIRRLIENYCVDDSPPGGFSRGAGERLSMRSPRRDSKPTKRVPSRIPAPVL